MVLFVAILHVLESYHDLKVQIQLRGEALEALKRNHAKDLRAFEDMAAGWQTKEKDYQQEVKRLEIMLSKTPQGMESMTLARASSVIYGSKKASSSINEGIGTIKQRNAGKSQQDTGLHILPSTA
jgi:hypothetical protein